MNTEIAFTKKCYRCPNVVRTAAMERFEFSEEFTICETCKVKLEVLAANAGETIPKDEAKSQHRETRNSAT